MLSLHHVLTGAWCRVVFVVSCCSLLFPPVKVASLTCSHTFDSLLQVYHGTADFLDEPVESLHFLDQHSIHAFIVVHRIFIQRGHSVEVLWYLLQYVCHRYYMSTVCFFSFDTKDENTVQKVTKIELISK